ncbi:MAG: DoxX protein [Alistipes sp.]|nr:DoxX protein [Alistipes sp.]
MALTRKRAFRNLAHVCRFILAATFIVSGFVKSVDPWGTALKVNEYLSIYGLEWLSPISMAFSIWMCGAELMMGLMLTFKVRIRLVSIFAVLSMIFFTLLTFLSATWIPVEDCGCFGDALKLTPWETFFKNLALLPLALIVWWRYRPDKIFVFKRLELCLMALFCTIGMGLGTYCYYHLPLVDFLPYKEGVNIREEMEQSSLETHEEDVVIVCRNKRTGRLREFDLKDNEWHNAKRWEWVETRVEAEDSKEHVVVKPLISEFSLRDGEGEDATALVTESEGRLYMIGVTRFEKISPKCAKRLQSVVERAKAEGAEVICVTPERMESMEYSFVDNGEAVSCYNIDATVLKTILRAETGLVVLDNGTITKKYNWRDIK